VEIAVHCLSIPFPCLPWRRYTTELRIDVKQDLADIERELDALYARFTRFDNALYDLPVICIDLPGLVLRYREADGEYYVYAEDMARRRLAGYVVFNRLIEIDRRADPHLRAPHAKIAPGYQRRGIATAIYQWWLDGGNCLMTGARQSAGADALWRSLSRNYESFYVGLRDRQLHDLGARVDRPVLHDLCTRIVLLGRGWSKESLAECTGMSVQDESRAQLPVRRRLLSRR
jgi:GNAT superfamily N-acetyltransferase